MYFSIGTIVNTQGIHGDVRIMPTTDDIKRFELLISDDVYVFFGDNYKTLQIKKVWYHKKFVILQFKGIDNMTEAEKLKGGVIKIPKDKALPLEEDEYYLSDLIGLNVLEEDGKSIGKVKDVLFTGANDVYVVSDDIDNNSKKEILIPAIKQCILNVDVANGTIKVKLPEGLLWLHFMLWRFFPKW